MAKCPAPNECLVLVRLLLLWWDERAKKLSMPQRRDSTGRSQLWIKLIQVSVVLEMKQDHRDGIAL